jgi:hypothetical protein
MAFSKNSGFRTASKRYTAGFGLILSLDVELPRRYNESVLGAGTERGLVLSGTVAQVLGARGVENAPTRGSSVSVLVRPGDARQAIFDDLEKTNEGFRFLLEGVTISAKGEMEARWAHGAGDNRSIEALEVVGAPHLTFENPVRDDGPRNGWLSLNLDGSPTIFDVRGADGVYTSHEIAYEDVVGRLKVALDKDLKFRVTQRVLLPSHSIWINDQAALEEALTTFREAGYTACVARSFVPGTTSAQEVDVQLMSWPLDVPAENVFKGVRYEMPTLQETKRFVALRDGDADARMELIPGYMLNLLGNKDPEKSTKHKFARSVIKGLSDGQMAMYGAQGYGPGISLCALAGDGNVSGLTRLVIRTDGPQYPNLMSIPTPHFLEADKVKYVEKSIAQESVDAIAD